MNPPTVWQIFRPLSIACLVAILGMVAFVIYVDAPWYAVFHNPFEAHWSYIWGDFISGIKGAGRTVLPPILLLVFAFLLARRFHLIQEHLARYGYRRIGSVAYLFMALEVFLIETAILPDSKKTWLLPIRFVFIISPGLLLLAWWGLRGALGRLRTTQA